MSATAQVSRPVSLNRRRRVRQKVHAPAYATFGGGSSTGMRELCEVLNISEVGLAIQSGTKLEINEQVDLCLDLAEASGPISATARVVWSDPSGRIGFCLPVLSDSLLHRLREWLFLNSIAGAANAASRAALESTVSTPGGPSKKYTDSLNAAAAIVKEAESLGRDIDAILSLIASRSNSLLRASGTAIALAEKEKETGSLPPRTTIPQTTMDRTTIPQTTTAKTMICRASAGRSAPPVGAILQVGSGFSGECVRTRKTLRCDDAETDDRVDRESCRALGLRSMLAAPIVAGDRAVGLLEVFSDQASAFDEKDGALLRRFAEAILAALNRATPVDDTPTQPPPLPEPSWRPPGSVLFAPAPEQKPKENTASGYKEKLGRLRLSRTYLYLLIAIAVIALALGFVLAPWIQEKLHGRRLNRDSAMLASDSSPLPISQAKAPSPSPNFSNLHQLRELAQSGDPAAENALGLMYAQGDEKQGIEQNETEAAHWFTNAAEHGSVPAQYKLGLLFWGGHGVPKDTNKAYFWAVLARAGGQPGSKDLAKVLANGMTRPQAAAIEQQAETWYQQHQPGMKSDVGH